MRKFTALALASTLVFGSVSMAFAADTAATAPAATEHSKPMHKGGRHGDPFAGLNLTEQQRQQMRDLMSTERQQHPRDEMKAHFESMHKLVAADSFDEAKAKAEIDSLHKAQAEQMLSHMRMENKMYNLLTPEQKKQFNENYQKRAEKMAEKHAERAARHNSETHSAN
ncbi:ATP-independent periplasmic protein-refolding chaperone Spy [Nissabacter sp. SGAir0207]|uniref:ATP-independent periplasmic protein-refolding chaperone Spy n=1 Tax=Nissabacter sp. SGAir0207 TaxID=2126321 RepID=UPI0010CD3FD1|nr:ATP-independent periplasmic protein-refolding chaperone Spy [Nissabacter sp. SGAir0207]QCR35886.1 ATP-independent periplasmic protein-refolding chaperone [Nissabacter sp. SGAir0207]